MELRWYRIYPYKFLTEIENCCSADEPLARGSIIFHYCVKSTHKTQPRSMCSRM